MTIKDKDLERWQKSILNALNNLTNVKARMDECIENTTLSTSTVKTRTTVFVVEGYLRQSIDRLGRAATLLNQRIEDTNE